MVRVNGWRPSGENVTKDEYVAVAPAASVVLQDSPSPLSMSLLHWQVFGSEACEPTAPHTVAKKSSR